MTGALSGRAILVTGGAMGIGRAIVERLARDGAAVTTIDVAFDEARSVARELEAAGHRVLAVSGDVTSDSDLDRAFAESLERFGRLDGLVNNVGVGDAANVEETEPDRWRRILDVSLGSFYATARRAIPHLRRADAPSVVNIASIVGQLGYPRYAAYAAAKGGVIALTRQMATDYGPEGIRVNAICPGTVLTPGVETWLQDQPDPESTRRDLSRWPVLRRLAEPAEIAAAVAWLLSDEASYVTGHALVVDGGASAAGYDAEPPEPA
jgi:NAD(P)-dependent dehydrogenase (short-subunit alcohol dehydrogenase family)